MDCISLSQIWALGLLCVFVGAALALWLVWLGKTVAQAEKWRKEHGGG